MESLSQFLIDFNIISGNLTGVKQLFPLFFYIGLTKREDLLLGQPVAGASSTRTA